MAAAATEVAAIHLAVLGEIAESGVDELCGVLAYDGHGRRHLHHLAPTRPDASLAARFIASGPRQLQLPFDTAPLPTTSSGRTWRTWVLPTIPTSLRTLPPEQLAAAFAHQLFNGAAS